MILLLCSMMTQVYEVDFCFTQIQEEWVISQLPPRSGYTQYMPIKLAEQVNLWDDPYWRCRARASDAILSDPANMRWMLWTIRSKDPNLQLYSEALLKKFLRCSKCKGTQYCQGFQPDPALPSSCVVCYALKEHHDDHERPCKACDQRGYFEDWPDCPYKLRHRY